MATTSIEWTDVTWNPTVGCTWASPGCDHCYAATMTRRLEAMGRTDYVGLTSSKHFNGTVRTLEHRLTDPLSWRKPRRVFVNSMSDLFHQDVPFEFIDCVFAVMALTPQHTYQILTKRPERMAKYFAETGRGSLKTKQTASEWVMAAAQKQAFAVDRYWSQWKNKGAWPLPNVHLGTSVEDQQRANERIPHLLNCPAAVRFLSVEPLLGPVCLNQCAPYTLGGDTSNPGYINTFNAMCWHPATARLAPSVEGTSDGIHWVIVGGESGPGARPCDIAWIRSVVAQCKAASVPVFVKQLGANCVGSDVFPAMPEGHKFDKKGGDMTEWPEDLRVREFPKVNI